MNTYICTDCEEIWHEEDDMECCPACGGDLEDIG